MSHLEWVNPSPSHLDLRSDVFTCPTPAMLTSIQHATLFDDVFAEDPTTNSLESFIATLTTKPAALLVLSGTMGNQLALRTHLSRPPHSILCDHRSHILHWEAGGTAAANGALVHGIIPANAHHLTLDDIQRHAVLGDEVHSCPTRVVSLENTLSGTVLPLAEVQRISAWCRAQDPPIALHMDGARLWEAVAAGHGALADYCAAADSVSLCFSKGLGAPIGSILVGAAPFIRHARWLRKSIGGGLRQSGVVAAPARVAVQDTFLGGRLQATHARARAIAQLWQAMGGRLTEPTETNMVWFDLAAAGVSKEAWCKLCADEGLKSIGGRLVVHYQIGDEAVARLRRVFAKVLTGTAEVDGREAEKVFDKVALSTE